jgi:hypothetical protein
MPAIAQPERLTEQHWVWTLATECWSIDKVSTHESVARHNHAIGVTTRRYTFFIGSGISDSATPPTFLIPIDAKTLRPPLARHFENR